MNPPLLQTWQWQKLQQDLGKTTFFEKSTENFAEPSSDSSAYQYLAILETTPLGNYLYCPYGPFATSGKSFKMALKSLQSLAKSNNAVFIRIEPQNPAYAKILPKNAKKSKDINPAETWVVDLTVENIFSIIPKRSKGYYNTYKQKGITIKTSQDPKDIQKLITLQKTLAKTKKINTFSENYLKTELSQPFSTLYTAEYDGKCISAVLVFDSQTTRHYMQAASDYDFRKLNANGILVTQMLIDAKTNGLKTFDFWGIAPENAPASHPWAGFTAFKKSFSGAEVDYAGTYDIILNRPRYFIYNFLRKLNLLIRKIKS